MKTYNYAVLILTHGRPNNVITTNVLKNAGYTGDIYYVVDTDDDTIPDYINNFGENKVIMFDKKAMAGSFDIMDNESDERCVVYARNKAFEIAKELKLDYFIVLDDDYNHFDYRFDKDNLYINSKSIKQMDKVFESMIKYLSNTNILTVCFAQGGDFFGGSAGSLATCIQTKRKAMNLFVYKTDRVMKFLGRMNEDVNGYLYHGMKGDIVLTTTQVSLEQLATQTNDGGLTDIYLEYGTYVKSFYSVMLSPSSVKIKPMGRTNKRLHHLINWNNTVPKIIDDKHKIIARE